MKEKRKKIEKYFFYYARNKKSTGYKREIYVVERTLKECKNDYYKSEIIRRKYFKKEKNYIISDSLGLCKSRYYEILNEIIYFALIVAVKENLIDV